MTTALLDGQQVFAHSSAGSAQPGPADCVGLNRKVVAITSAQLLAIKDTAITLLPAPGAGFMIVPIAVLIDMQAGSAAYTDGGGAVSLTQGSWAQALAANTVFLAGIGLRNHQLVDFAALATAAATPTNENAALTLTKITNNFAAGNGTALVTILYLIAPVPPVAN
jgi:hypothetical protein